MKMTLSSTLQDETYHLVRQWLSLGRWMPGERLKIKQLAQEMNKGEMPVRMALQRLVAEKALVNIPHCGVAVPQLTRNQFDDILQTRLLLEGEATERAARSVTPHHKEAMRQLADLMHTAIGQQDIKAYLHTNEAFHIYLYRIAGSPMLLSLIEGVWLHIGPLSTRLIMDRHVWDSMNDSHEDLLGALHREDAGAARRAIERDIFNAGQYLRTQCLQN